MAVDLRHHVWELSTALALVCITSAAAAQPEIDSATALQRFNEGKALLEAGDWQGGCEKFDQALTLQVNVSTLIKVARCRTREGKLVAASRLYERARVLNQEQSDRGSARQVELAAVIQRELAELTPRIPRLRVLVEDAPPGLIVRADGAPVGRDEVFLVDPGTHQVTAEAPGYIGETRSVTVEPTQSDQILEVTLRLTPQSPATAPSADETSASSTGPAARALAAATPGAQNPAPRGETGAVPPSTAPMGSGGSEGVGREALRPVGYLLGGVGLAGLGAAGVLGVLTLERVNDSNPYCDYPGDTCDGRGTELRNEARQLQTASIVAASVSGAVLIGGIVIVATAGRHSPRASVVLGPTCLTGRVRW